MGLAKVVAAALLLVFQIIAVVDQFQYEAAYNVPQDFSARAVIVDVFWGNITDFGPVSDHWSRTFDGADPACANQGQIFNNSFEWTKKSDPTNDVIKVMELVARAMHSGGVVGAELGSFAYEMYDTAMSYMYDKEEREPGACVL